MDQIWLWIGFNIFVLAMLAVDLFVFHNEAHEVSLKEAAPGAPHPVHSPPLDGPEAP